MSISSAYPLTSYDQLPYPSHPFAQSHPSRLATVATLLGLKPARPDRCWVLELGCAAGGNLIPMALAFPESTFVGIDLSTHQVAEGQKTIDALGLKNISLRHQSIMDVPERFGEFDFIICHGVYSWVPAAVQERILTLYKQCLAPEGVGYISYNTYPGWHMRGMIRAMMGLNDRRLRDRPPLTRVEQARALLTFLAKSVPAGDGPYGLLLREQLDLLSSCSDAYLFHEHLEECNEPLYFTDFCDRLSASGLRFLAESELGVMVPSTSFPAEVQEELSRLAPKQIELEQYMDLLRNRSFRQTLVCHEHIQSHYEIRAEQVFDFHVAAAIQPAPGKPGEPPDETEKFKGRNGLTLVTASPVVKAAAHILGEAWPRAVPFDHLLTAARARMAPPPAADAAAQREDALDLGRALLTAFATTGKPLVELSLCPPVFADVAGERPIANPLARLQALTENRVTNLRHESVGLGEIDRQLLQLLDGTRDREALRKELVDRQGQGCFKIAENDEPVTDPTRIADILSEALEQRLVSFAKEALLIG